MTQTVLSDHAFRTLVSQQGLTCDEAEFAEFHEAYLLVRAMAARVRKPRSRMAEPAAVFIPSQTAST